MDLPRVIPGGIFLLCCALMLYGLYWVLFYYDAFAAELRIIKMEIRRSHGEEQQYWLKEKRRLWLTVLPFVRY